MTAVDLQDELVKELGKLFENHKYKTTGGERVALNIYAQDLPAEQSYDDADPSPYLIVRIDSGKDSGEKDSFNTVTVVIVAEVYDDNPNKQGYRDVIAIIQKIYARFHKDPSLNNTAVYSGAFDWDVQDGTYYPYFIGACVMDFHIPAIRREDPWV